MKIIDFGFLSIRLLDILDIMLVALLLYGLYRIVKGSIALNIFMGFLSVYIFWFIVRAMNMKLLSGILGQFIGVGAIALLVVFQQEIRRFLLLIGRNRVIFSQGAPWRQILPWNWNAVHTNEINFDEIARACKHLARTYTGALIVISRAEELKFFASTGITIEAELTSKLLESIFIKKSPLHDGAIIINKNKIVAASCILPVSERQDLPSEFGLRHRSALGVSEQTDAMAIVVSEESGKISVASKGEITRNINQEDLALALYQAYFEIMAEEVK